MKAAEANEEVAKHTAKTRLIQADADLEAADKEARAKMRMAEGVQAEQAADGLAKARVLEAQAIAEEKRGLALVRVKEAEAQAIEKQGAANAGALKAKMLAEAEGDKCAPREPLLNPQLSWMWRHQNRMSQLNLLAAQNTYRLWQSNWNNIVSPQRHAA